MWEVPIVMAAAFMGANKWLDKQLAKVEEEKGKEHENHKRYNVLVEGVIPDLYQFYQEMDEVVENLQDRNLEDKFVKDMDKLVEFMCVCEEPAGVPTVQNMVMAAMAARNCGMDQHSSPQMAPIFKEILMGEIRRTSLSPHLRADALAASASIIETMFPDKPSELSTYRGRKLREA